MRLIPSAILAAMISSFLMLLPFGALAQSEARKCRPEQFAQRIDETGEVLRTISRKTEPQLNAKFARLARARGWPAAEAEERGYDFIKDTTIADYDRRARNLLLELDKLGAVDAASATCANLERLEQVTRDLREVTNAKVAYVHSKLDAALARPSDQTARAPAPRPPQTKAPPPANPTAKPPAAPTPQRSANTRDWQTSTTRNQDSAATSPGPEAFTGLPPRTSRNTNSTYSTEEISHAGRGLFGTISANLASVIRYAFATYGKPNGYILGTEGGGAFLAGLSYGKGELHTKFAPPRTVYWQGPTVGYDLGLTGSRVMFLIYNLEGPDDIFDRFGGLGGSAYVVGGVGLTFHQRGDTILAPIRTGLGLRIGANIGYLKFTPKRSLNPF